MQRRRPTRRTGSTTVSRKQQAGNDATGAAPAGMIPGQSLSLLSGYVREDARDEAVRRVSATEQHPSISAWLFAIDLFTTAFAHDRDDGTSPFFTPATDLSFALRHQLLAGAARAVKPALDLVLAGYYREAWALERTMLDEWAECVYLRMQLPDAPVPPCEPSWREVTRLIAARGDEGDRVWLEEATPRWDFLNVAVRPLSRNTADSLAADLDSMAFQAVYNGEFCQLALSCGLFVQCALLREVATLAAQPQQWTDWYGIFVEVVTPVYASTRDAMERWTKARNERCSGSRPRE